MFRRPILLLIAIFCIAYPRAHATAQGSSSVTQIVYSSNYWGPMNIFTMNINGSNARRIETYPSDQISPTCASSGTRIAFSSIFTGVTNGRRIETIDWNGANRVTITDETSYNSQPSWSPDGTRIAYTANRDDTIVEEGNEIYVMNSNGSNIVRLTDNDRSDASPTWSPNGTRIAFVSVLQVGVDDLNPEIFLMNPDGSNVTQITNSAAVDREPSWSPDGTKIAFRSDRDGNDELYVMNADGSNIVRLTTSSTYDGMPSWSPDGSKIAFVSLRHGNDNPAIYVMNSNGINVQLLTDTSVRSLFPCWLVIPTPNLITNGTFATGALSPWTAAATPNASDLVSRIQSNVLEFYRTTTSTSGAISQTTGVALPALTPLEARLSIGNSSAVRKRLTVTLEDANDPTRQQNCVFWLPASAALNTFIVRTYTPQAWGNLRLTLSEGTATGTGWLRVDNVEVRQQPGGSVVSTTCTDPNIPTAASGTDAANLFSNGNFANGLNGWYFGGDITYQLTAGMLEFYKTVGGAANATVVNTTAQLNAASRFELTLDLGNSSATAKRITVILNDGDWTDSQTCNFWLPGGTALARHTMRTFNYTVWNPVHVSIFESVSGQAWTQLDNVDLRRRSTLPLVGTECYQPGAALP